MRRTVLALLLSLLGIHPVLAAERLPALGARLEETSVSGLSSGAFMAAQLEVAFSSIVVGAGIVAGGPYGCAETWWSRHGLPTFGGWANFARATGTCMAATRGVPDGAALADRAAALAEEGRIDPLAGLADDRVYLFHGEADTTVVLPVVEAAAAFYRRAGVPAASLQPVHALPGHAAGHAFIVTAGGNPCGPSGPPFIESCGYDQAGALLAWIYPDIDHGRGPQVPAGQRLVFDQTEFQPGGGRAGLAGEGVVYIPPGCRAGGCRVHIALHGCRQSRTSDGIGDAFIERTGYLGWADANRLIVLFPQTDAATAPNACWDWWGYTGPGFLGRQAPQLAALRAMVGRLAEPPT